VATTLRDGLPNYGDWLRTGLVERRVRTEPDSGAPLAFVVGGRVRACTVRSEPLKILQIEPQGHAAKDRFVVRVGRLGRLGHAQGLGQHSLRRRSDET
jgi:hypothetical protein